MAGGGTGAGRAAAGAIVIATPGADKTRVAGADSAGNSSSMLCLPCEGPSEALRNPTDCSTRPLPRGAPTLKALAGLPSTAMSANP